MSRIQRILDKAERDGRASRTRGVAPLMAPPAGVAGLAPETTPLATEFVGEATSPDMPGRRANPLVDTTVTLADTLPGRRVTLRPHPLLTAAVAPHSPAAEQYRALRARMALSADGRAQRTILVTSPQRGDGKTLTAANLAFTMAQEYQRRVLLVDADLRKPEIHALLGLAPAPGLTDVLIGGASLEEAIVEAADYHLSVLTAGGPTGQPAELLGSSAMRSVLADLGTRFDRVVIDCPPAGILADVSILSPLVDAALLVVRAGKTPIPAIERVVSDFDASRLLGLVLNDASEVESGYGTSAYGYGEARGAASPRR